MPGAVADPVALTVECRQRHEQDFGIEHGSVGPGTACADQPCCTACSMASADPAFAPAAQAALAQQAAQASQINAPDYAPLMVVMFFTIGTDIPFKTFIAPRVEVELAFILGKPLKGPNVTLFDVLSATEYVTPALEIIDARIEQLDRHTQAPRKVLDTIADNAANAGIVLGGRPVRPDAVDLRWVGALLHKNGVIEETGLAAAVLNHPATGVACAAHRPPAGAGNHGHPCRLPHVQHSGQ